MGLTFTQQIEAPQVVLSELTTKNAWPEGQIVYVTDLDAIYVSTGATWAVAANAAPITPSYTFATLPAAGVAGRLVRLTDNIRGLWWDNGTVWKSVSGAANVVDFGATGDGVTDDRAAIQAAVDAVTASARYNETYFPHTGAAASNTTVYLVSAPLVFPAASRRYRAQSHGSRTQGVTFKASASFTGVAIIKDSLWDTNINEWAHWLEVDNLTLDCNNVAQHGVAIHQLGEESVLRRVAVFNPTTAGYLLTGVHAPATLEMCSTWGGPAGFKFTTHPDVGTLTNKTGNGGVVRLIGPSGDSSTAGSIHIYSNGAHKMSVLGIKSEQWANLLKWEGSGTGGGAGSAFISGYANAINAQTNMILIGGTAAPILTLAGLTSASYTNIINDGVRVLVLPAATYAQLPNGVTWNGSLIHGAAEVVLDYGTPLVGRRSDGVKATLFEVDSSNTTRIGTTGDGGGVRIDSATRAQLWRFRSVANGGTEMGANFLEGAEIVDPAAPAADRGRCYFKDNGAGKTQLVVRFPTGAVQVLATEP